MMCPLTCVASRASKGSVCVYSGRVWWIVSSCSRGPSWRGWSIKSDKSWWLSGTSACLVQNSENLSTFTSVTVNIIVMTRHGFLPILNEPRSHCYWLIDYVVDYVLNLTFGLRQLSIPRSCWTCMTASCWRWRSFTRRRVLYWRSSKNGRETGLSSRISRCRISEHAPRQS